MTKKYLSIFFLSSFFIPFSANAYIGPGLGGGVFSVIIGIFFSVLLAIFGILYYPIKKLFLKIKKIFKK